MGLWGKVKKGVSSKTFKGALLGSMIDPVAGGLVGGMAGKHKKNHEAGGPATPAPQVGNIAQQALGGQAGPNPYNTQQSLKGAPPQVQGPATNYNALFPQGGAAAGKGTPPNMSAGNSGPMTQQMQASAKGR